MRLIDLLTQHPLLDTEISVNDIYKPLGFETHIETHEPPIDPEDLGREAFETYARSPDAYIDSLGFELPAGFTEAARFENEDNIVLLALKPISALAELLLAQVETSEALADIARERRRQVEAEGWTAEHDDAHTTGELAGAACTYAWAAFYLQGGGDIEGEAPAVWPWDDQWFKPYDGFTRNLEKAGALTLAEMERIARAEQRQGGDA